MSQAAIEAIHRIAGLSLFSLDRPSSLLLSVPRPLPKTYENAPARRKTANARKRKRALYVSLTGIRMLKFRRPRQYVRLAE